MDNVKSNILPKMLNIIKCAMFAVVITLIGTIFLAVILKFVDLSSTAIEWLNNVIKVISLFILVKLIKKTNEGKFLLKAVIGGAVYAVLSFLIFSILNGSVVFNLNFVYDLLFSIIVSVLVAIISSVLTHKNS